jgi:hypothetical protein
VGGDPVVLDRILERVRPIGDHLDLCAHAPLRDRQELGARGLDELEAVVPDQRVQPTFGQVEGAHHRAAEPSHLALVDGPEVLTGGARSLGDTEAHAPARDEGLGLRPPQVVEHLPVDPLDERGVLEAFGGQEGDPAAGPLDERVRPDRGSVREALDVPRCDSEQTSSDIASGGEVETGG